MLPGDGIGQVVAEAVKVFEAPAPSYDLKSTRSRAREARPETEPASRCRPSDATFRPDGRCRSAERRRRVEIRYAAALRQKNCSGCVRRPIHQPAPAFLYPQLASASTLKPRSVGSIFLSCADHRRYLLRRAARVCVPFANGERQGFNTMVYAEHEVSRVARVAFDAARKRRKKICSVEKANVLETSGLWREVVVRGAGLSGHRAESYVAVDNAAMQLVRAPAKFDDRHRQHLR